MQIKDGLLWAASSVGIFALSYLHGRWRTLQAFSFSTLTVLVSGFFVVKLMGCLHPNSTQAGSKARRVRLGKGKENRNSTAETLQQDSVFPSKPAPLADGAFQPRLDGVSNLLSSRDVAALAAALPYRHSTARDGTSLQTLYRKASKAGPCVLLVRDLTGHVFGCFASDPWRVHPRYFGNGEAFVFQLAPQRFVCRWHRQGLANDMFQLAYRNKLAMGSGPAHALRLSDDLLSGSSGASDTFGNPCLASGEDFEVGKLEVWHLVDPW